jgi:hypothetical protein
MDEGVAVGAAVGLGAIVGIAVGIGVEAGVHAARTNAAINNTDKIENVCFMVILFFILVYLDLL